MLTIGERIKLRRITLGLSADAVAEALGKNRATVYRYESDDIQKLPTTVLEPLSKVLQTTPSYLMGWTDEDSANKNTTIANVVNKLRSNDTFLSVAEKLCNMDDNQLNTINQMLSAFEIKKE